MIFDSDSIDQRIKEMWQNLKQLHCIVCGKEIPYNETRCEECKYETEVKHGIQR